MDYVNSVCTPCDKGTYSLLINQAACNTCPGGAHCTASAVIADPGFYTFYQNGDASTGVVLTHPCYSGWCTGNGTCARNRITTYSSNVLCGDCVDNYALVLGECVCKRYCDYFV